MSDKKTLELLEKIGIRKEQNIDLGYVYAHFRGFLFERLMRIFIYDNTTPFPEREIEYRYLKSGAVAIVNDSKVGLMAAWASLSGVTEYTDVYKYITYAAPTAQGGTLTIGRQAVVSYNNSMHQSLQSHVEIYASLMAHWYLTLRCGLINARSQDVLVAVDDNTRDNIDKWYDDMYNGKPRAILNDTLFGLADSVGNLTSSAKNGGNLSDLFNTGNEILRAFFRDIGIRYARPKNSNTVESEVTSDQQMLLYNIDDMFAQRKQLCDDYNALFVDGLKLANTRMTVRINPIFDVISDSYADTDSIKEEGFNDDDNT